jgi:hypothetical protein
MEENAFIMEAIAGVVYFVVGARLFALGRQTGHAPERLVALTFLFWALCYAFFDIPYLFAEPGESIAPFFAYSSLLALNLGNLACAMFTRVAFRANERWSFWLVVAIAALLVAGAAGSAWVGDWEQIDPVGNPGYWPQTLGGLAPPIWMGFEGFRQFINARRRRKLGLCDPFTCQNFLLWGIAGALWAGLELVVAVQDHIYLSAGDWSEGLGILNGLLEIVPIAIMWLVFFPPATYRRWIERASPA